MTKSFQRVGLLGRFADPNVAQPAAAIAAHLASRDRQVLLGAQDAMPAILTDWATVAEDELAARVDLIIAVGGDGTMLHAARRVAGQPVPLVGVNRGRLGFLTDVSPDQMAASVDSVLSGDYIAESRLMLRAEIAQGDSTLGPMLALNDVVLQKWNTGRMLDFITWVDGEYVNTHGGDGLIVATPTGSTAYALSCGGPIMEPHVDALVMVPICPHTLSDRPLVLRASSTIEVEIDRRLDIRALVTCDGEDLGEISPGERITIHAAEERVELLHPVGHSYYELLRSKLSWGLTGRNPRQGKNR
jgi:NAD+ kinase